MVLKGQLSNPLKIAATLVAHGSKRIGGFHIRPSDDHADGRREEKGRDELPLELDLAGDRSFDDGRLVGMSSNAIQQLMKRLDAPSPHAWRRGWAVHALKRGISQVSVQTAAGWSSGAMVARYTSGMSAELAISEFILRRNEPHNKLFI